MSASGVRVPASASSSGGQPHRAGRPGRGDRVGQVRAELGHPRRHRRGHRQVHAGRQVGVRQLGLGVPAAGGQLVDQDEQVERRSRSLVKQTTVDSGSAISRSPSTARTASASPATASRVTRGQPQVAVVAEVPQGGVRGGDRPAGAGGGDHRVDHRVAGPVGVREVLRGAQRRVAVQQHRDALRGVRVLVQVDRDRGDPGARRSRTAAPARRAGAGTAASSRRSRRPRGSAPRPPPRPAAISATGSTTPCAYDGAEQATSTVSGADRGGHRRPASGRRVTGETGTRSRATRR